MVLAVWKRTWLAALLLTAVAAADVTLISAFPKDVNVRLGERETSLEPRQSLTLPPPAAGASLVVSADGKTVYAAQVTDNRFWVLHPQGTQEAGVVHAAGSPRGAVGFFNALPYTIVLHLSAEKVSPDPEPIRVASMQVSPPVDLPSEAPFSITLKDEVGNPIGTCWSHARGGHYYLVYRKRNTLYDLVTLGTFPARKP